jgi:hypothetical protein
MKLGKIVLWPRGSKETSQYTATHIVDPEMLDPTHARRCMRDMTRDALTLHSN